ncbi:MAG: serine protease [Thermodesulfobacteriota bacterium]
MANIEEERYQEEAAFERYTKLEKSRESDKKKLESKSVQKVESRDRYNVRRSLINNFDGLALERVLGNIDLISINYFEQGIKASKPVCRIHVRLPNGKNAGFGTGFLISPNLLLTNHHVLNKFDVAKMSLAEFNFENDIKFIPKDSKVFRLNPGRFFYNNRKLDFAIVAVHPVSTQDTPLSEFGYLELIERSGKALISEQVSIIQHPSGSDKQIALRNNKILDIFQDFVHYETDTLPGSSGSPVFNDQWRVVALHHSGVIKRDAKGNILAKDQKTIWTPSMGDDQICWIANEGVRISSIFKHLRSKADWTPQHLRLLNDLETPGETESERSFGARLMAAEDSAEKGHTKKAAKPKAITIEEFYKLLDSEDITEEQIAEYIKIDPESSEAFNPQFRFNEDQVIDTTGVESDRVISWANSISRRFRLIKYFKRLARGGRFTKIVSEGDSWFQYPFFLHDLIDHLIDDDKLAVYSLGAGGDLLRDMTTKAEYVAIIKQENPSYFLISGGGNDLVGGGGLSEKVKMFDPNRKPKDYLTEQFAVFEDEIRSQYQRLFSNLTTEFPNLKTLCHGYDYIVPKGGKWLGAPLERNGINDSKLQREILIVIMDRMNDIISNAADQFPNITYLKLTDIVPRNGWYDELHPKSSNFGALAAVFMDAIL